MSSQYRTLVATFASKTKLNIKAASFGIQVFGKCSDQTARSHVCASRPWPPVKAPPNSFRYRSKASAPTAPEGYFHVCVQHVGSGDARYRKGETEGKVCVFSL